MADRPDNFWYSVGVFPAIILCICAYALVCFVLVQRKGSLPALFFGLVVASCPLILVLPSYYVNSSPDGMFVGIRPTEKDLNQIATLGMTGVVLAFFMLIVASILARSSASPLRQGVRTISRSVTEVFTKVIYGHQNGAAGPSAPQGRHGIVKVIRGRQQGAQISVIHGARIGQREATLTITDPVVSRRHARFEIQDDRPYLINESKTNGTYLMHDGNTQKLGDQPLPLQHGDKIYLGQPGHAESVELSFEMPGAGGA